VVLNEARKVSGIVTQSDLIAFLLHNVDENQVIHRFLISSSHFPSSKKLTANGQTIRTLNSEVANEPKAKAKKKKKINK